MEERGKSALATLQQLCDEAGIPCQTKQVTGVVSRAIVESAGLADVIVIGRSGEHSAWLEGLMGSTTEAVIRRAGQPVIVTATESFGTDKILLAYDGSDHAGSALRMAARVLLSGCIMRLAWRGSAARACAGCMSLI